MADVTVFMSQLSGRGLRFSDAYHTSQAYRFVDADRGYDNESGTMYQPWRTLAHGLVNIQNSHDLFFAGDEIGASFAVANKSNIRLVGELGATFTGNITLTNCTNIVIDLDIIGLVTFDGCTNVKVRRGANITFMTAINHNGYLEISGDVDCDISVQGVGVSTTVLINDNRGPNSEVVVSAGMTGDVIIKNSVAEQVTNAGGTGPVTLRVENSFTATGSLIPVTGAFTDNSLIDQSIDGGNTDGKNAQRVPSTQAVVDFFSGAAAPIVLMDRDLEVENLTSTYTEIDIPAGYTRITINGVRMYRSGTALANANIQLSNENGVFQNTNVYTVYDLSIGTGTSVGGASVSSFLYTQFYHAFSAENLANGVYVDAEIVLRDDICSISTESLYSGSSNRVFRSRKGHFYGANGFPTKMRINGGATINKGRLKIVAYAD